MIALVDTSVLVPSFLGNHPDHVRSLKLLSNSPQMQFLCAAHTIAEFYAVTTGMQIRPRITPDMAMSFIDKLTEQAALIALTTDDYLNTVRAQASKGQSGGRLYDALILACAVKGKADVIYTWNLKHFRDLAQGTGIEIKTPE